jgi:hypothetical protein
MATTNLLSGLATEETQLVTEKNLTDIYNMMAFFLDRLEFGMITDNAKQLKVNVNAGSLTSVGTVSTVTTVSTVSTLTNQARIGDIQSQRQVEGVMDMAFADGILRNITF